MFFKSKRFAKKLVREETSKSPPNENVAVLVNKIEAKNTHEENVDVLVNEMEMVNAHKSSAPSNSRECARVYHRSKEAEVSNDGIPKNSYLAKHVLEAKAIFNKVAETESYNFKQAKVRVPSGLNIENWKRYLQSYEDREIIQYLEFGWPTSFDRRFPLTSTPEPHKSGREHPESVQFYIETELKHGALLGPFHGPPVNHFHLNPLMSREKKDSDKRRIILDLSWPENASVNAGIDNEFYLENRYDVHLPTIDLMEKRILDLGKGCYLYKTDLSRGYRQLRIDPIDWPLLGFTYDDKYYMDICPPFGLRSAAMMMQRTSKAVSFIQGKLGYIVYPYIDDFGGGEIDKIKAEAALSSLQNTLVDLGLDEAKHKVCEPTQKMIWLGILFDTINMTMSIPEQKLKDIMEELKCWASCTHATRREMQSVLGSLQFVAKVSPPFRLFINRMLECLKDTPGSGSHTLSWGFKKDVDFFLRLLPKINGVRIINKSLLVPKDVIELDACLSGCGAWCASQFYGRKFPKDVIDEKHSIAHLEMLNLVVAVKVWAKWWAGHRIEIRSDNMNTCLLVMSGKSKDDFMLSCARELYEIVAAHDIDLSVIHVPGLSLTLADALSREHTGQKFENIVKSQSVLKRARRVRPGDALFRLKNVL